MIIQPNVLPTSRERNLLQLQHAREQKLLKAQQDPTRKLNQAERVEILNFEADALLDKLGLKRADQPSTEKVTRGTLETIQVLNKKTGEPAGVLTIEKKNPNKRKDGTRPDAPSAMTVRLTTNAKDALGNSSLHVFEGILETGKKSLVTTVKRADGTNAELTWKSQLTQNRYDRMAPQVARNEARVAAGQSSWMLRTAATGRTFNSSIEVKQANFLSGASNQSASISTDFDLTNGAAKFNGDSSFISQKLYPIQQVAVDAVKFGEQKGEKLQTVNMPTGTGKTMIGAGIIQQSLEQLESNGTILIVAPSNRIKRQWKDTLCYYERGLNLRSTDVFSGTPSELKKRMDPSSRTPRPRVLIVSQQALNTLSKGDGGFDGFINRAGVERVLVDEIHTMAGKATGAGFKLLENLGTLAQSGQMKGVVGLSATTDGVANNLETLGFSTAIAMSPEQMVQRGYIPPYAAYGVVSTLSSNEQAILDKREELKNVGHEMLSMLDSSALTKRFMDIYEQNTIVVPDVVERQLANGPLLDACTWGLTRFGEKPNERRRNAIRRITDLVKAIKQADELGDLKKPFKLDLPTSDLVEVIQLVDGLSDADLMKTFATHGTDPGSAIQQNVILIKAKTFRNQLAELAKAPKIKPVFSGTYGSVPTFAEGSTKEERIASMGQTLLGTIDATKLVRSYFGEGLSDTIRLIQQAENTSAKSVGESGAPMLVFRKTQALQLPDDPSIPVPIGQNGIIGMLLGSAAMNPSKQSTIAGQNDPVVIPEADGGALKQRLLTNLRNTVISGEVKDSLLKELTADLPNSPELNEALSEGYERFVGNLVWHEGTRLSQPWTLFKTKMTHAIESFEHRQKREKKDPLPAEIKRTLLERISNAKESALQSQLVEVFGFTTLFRKISQAPTRTGVLESGVTVPFSAVVVGSSAQRELMTALVNSSSQTDDINNAMSKGAAQGTDLRRASVIINTEHVGSPTEFRQMLGRGLRTMPEWNAADTALLGKLIGTPAIDQSSVPNATAEELAELQKLAPAVTPELEALPEDELSVLKTAWVQVYKNQPSDWISALPSTWTEQQRIQLATALTVARNKTTNMYVVVEKAKTKKSPDLDEADGRFSFAEGISKNFGDVEVAGPDGTVKSGPSAVTIINPSLDTGPADLKAKLAATLAGSKIATTETWFTQCLGTTTSA